MPWKECDVVSLREEFVALALVEGANMAALCRRYGLSRKTAYKWVERYLAGGRESLKDRSRRPHRFRCRTSESMEEAVLSVREAHRAWGGRKIRARLLATGVQEPPSASTITAILQRHHRIAEEESVKRQPTQRFEYSEPNELWQMDFKGEFAMTDGRYCYPLTLLDDHSRFCLAVRACGNQWSVTVREQLVSVFSTYGLPRAMLMDNGTPWAISHSPGGWTKLSAWLLRLDVRVLHGRPYHPQTQGKEERFHRTLKAELLRDRRIDTLAEAQRLFEPWRESYNLERPHEALKMATPASRYRISLRSYPAKLPTLEYAATDQVRRVNPVGQFRFGGRQCKTSEAFGGESIALRATTTDGLWDVYYAHQRIGQLDLRQQPKGSRNVRVLSSACGRCAASGVQQDP